MKKYINGFICIFFSILKFFLIKLFHFNRFRFSLINLVSPNTEIEIGKNSNLILGKMVRIKSGSKIYVRKGAELKIGHYSSFNHRCMVVSHEKVIIGDYVQLGPNVLIYDHDHDYKAENGLKELKYKTSPVEIGNNVWIGANVVILRGTKLGDNCVVGAGCVIKGSFDSNSLIVQNRETEITVINNQKGGTNDIKG